MDNLQYNQDDRIYKSTYFRFKPYYKWIIFNICYCMADKAKLDSFKPYYKWIIFNIQENKFEGIMAVAVLNLIING